MLQLVIFPIIDLNFSLADLLSNTYSLQQGNNSSTFYIYTPTSLTGSSDDISKNASINDVGFIVELNNGIESGDQW